MVGVVGLSGGDSGGQALSNVERWTAWMRAGGSPATTVNLRRYYVERLEAERGALLGLGVDDLTAWLGGHGWAPNTMKSARAALRSFYGLSLIHI